LKEQEHVDYNQ